jgi:transcriptional regulator with XRE-family HTH domain
LSKWSAQVKKSPDPTDKHVGTSIRMRRLMLDISQTDLAEAIGVAFQQVQKYEKGTNRVSASRLQQMSRVMQVPIAFFFEGLPSNSSQSKEEHDPFHPSYVSNFFATPDGHSPARAFVQIKDRKLRLPILHLVEEIAGPAK